MIYRYIRRISEYIFKEKTPAAVSQMHLVSPKEEKKGSYPDKIENWLHTDTDSAEGLVFAPERQPLVNTEVTLITISGSAAFFLTADTPIWLSAMVRYQDLGKIPMFRQTLKD